MSSQTHHADLIAVAMSGGVDSSVAAAKAKARGARVIGITMRIGDDDGHTRERAAAVADSLDVPHHVLDLRSAFDELVLRTCWDEYAQGRTPNPCVICNEQLKFGLLLQEARRLAPDAAHLRLATGHHARLEQDGATKTPILLRGLDAEKDQSYFLARLHLDQLAAAIFPIGEMTKAEVRDAARALHLPSAEAPESQDTCIALAASTGREGAFAETLRLRFGESAAPGVFVDQLGNELGAHPGIHRFTRGQRRGLGIALGRRAYVQSIDAPRRRVLLTTEVESLRTRHVAARRARWLIPLPEDGRRLRCEAQIRYRHQARQATATAEGDRLIVELDEPVTAATPGQALVLYQGARVIASGWIDTTDNVPENGS